MTLDDVIEKIKKAYASRVATIRTATEAVRNAVNKYETAAQDDALNQFLATNGIPSGAGNKADNAALDLLQTVEQLPELRTAPVATQVIELKEEEVESEDESIEEEVVATRGRFPVLQEDGRPLLIFGGFVVEQKKKTIETRTGLKVDWVSNERNGNGDSECDTAQRRIRNGQYSGLIMLNELMSHRQSDQLVKAAKAAGIHHAVGKKGGTAAIMGALDMFEQQRVQANRK